MGISRDKKRPTWAYVWDGEKPEEFTDEDKRIIIDACDDGCVCVYYTDGDNYIADKCYSTVIFKHFKIIEEPEYRPFGTIEEYIEATKDRKDLRAINVIGREIYDLSTFYEKEIGDGYFAIHGYCLDSVTALKKWVWLDDRSPVGVKVK